jgi:TonB family protein
MEKSNINNKPFKFSFALFTTVTVMLFAGIVNANAQDKPFTQVEQMPEYPGGIMAMQNFLSTNLKYPTEAKEKNIQGRVIVSFIVDTDGKLTDVSVLKSVDPLLDSEAVRMIYAMPAWKPGMQDGKTVRVSFSVPVNFKIPAPKKDVILVQYAKGEDGKMVVNCTLTNQAKLTEEEKAAIIDIKDLDSKITEINNKRKDDFFVLPNNPETMDEFNSLNESLGKFEGVNVNYKQN